MGDGNTVRENVPEEMAWVLMDCSDLSIDKARVACEAILHWQSLRSKEFELSGRPAEQFTVTISERQFSVTRNHAGGGSELLAMSSSSGTFLKCVNRMLELGTGTAGSYVANCEFEQTDWNA